MLAPKLVSILLFAALSHPLRAELSPEASTDLTRAAAMRKAGQSKESVMLLRTVLTKATGESKAWASQELASALLAESPSHFPEAQRLYEEAVRLFDEQGNASQAATALLDSANAALQENMHGEPLSKLLGNLRQRFDNGAAETSLATCVPAYWQLQGQLRLAQGQFQEAAKAFGLGRAALGKLPQQTAADRLRLDAELNGGRAVALWRGGQEPEAWAAFKQSLATMEGNAKLTGIDKLELRQNFALALLSWDQPQEAAAMLKQAMEEAAAAHALPLQLIAPGLNRGLAELASKNHAESLTTLETAWQHAQLAQAAGQRLRAEVASTRWLARRDRESATTSARESAAWMDALLSGPGEEARQAQRRWLDPLAASLAQELLQEPNGVNQAANAMLSVQGAVFEADYQRTLNTNLYQRQIRWDTVQQALPKGTSYVQITTHLTPAVAPGHWEDTCSTLLVSPEGPPIILPGPGQLRAWLQELGATMSRTQRTTEEEAELVTVLHEAREQLWEPILSHLENSHSKRVFLCVDGPLSTVPWSCLLDKNSLPILLGNQEIVFLSSPRALLRCKENPEQSLQGKWLVVDASLPNAALPAAAKAADNTFPQNQLPLQAIPGAHEEALVVAALGKDSQLLSQAEATETKLRATVKEHPPVLWHFAGHGAVNEKADGEVSSSRFWEGATTPTGMEQIGLLFPDFGRQKVTPEADGWLPASEISSLPLSHTQLVVFSSCQGGRGLATSGEGRFDLARAAHLAGARDVLVAAGPVWDQAAVGLMKDFYQQVQQGTDPTAAAWKSQQNLWKKSQSVSLFRAIRNTSPYRLVRHR